MEVEDQVHITTLLGKHFVRFFMKIWSKKKICTKSIAYTLDGCAYSIMTV
jgi:hypothetical protein